VNRDSVKKVSQGREVAGIGAGSTLMEANESAPPNLLVTDQSDPQWRRLRRVGSTVATT
jgi:hypothetical protein